MKDTIFTGAGVAIVTPFNTDGTINYHVFGKLIDFQINNGTDAIIVCGTTGESATLNHDEHSQVIKFAVDYVARRVPVISGTGSNDTAYGLKLSNEAERAGVDGLLMVTPYYNKTTQAGLIKHYYKIADNVSTPIIVYNVPGRTSLDVAPETYFELSKHKRIVAIKEANGNISSVAKTAALCGDNLDIYSGNDDQITAVAAMGGKGVISVMSNILPQETHDIAISALQGDFKKSRELQLKYLDLCNDLFIEVNPAPVKEALKMMGWDVGECRLPLVSLEPNHRKKLKQSLIKHGLIKE